MNSPSLSPGRSPQASKSSFTKSISDVNAQSFSSILNNPNSSSSLLGSWFSSSSSAPVPEFAPLPTQPKPGSELTRPEFQTYLSSVSEPHARFLDILRQHERDDQSEQALSTPGAALVACLREVPALYFKEDFELEDGATFKSACPFRTVAENIALQEKLSQYLDVVELHLVREISLRSSSFFEAQVQLEDLTEKIVEGCGRVRELKEMIRVLDSDLVGSARKVQKLSAKRGDLVGLQNKLRLVLSVNQALSTLQLLVASADCLGALDIIDDLQHLLEGDDLIGLHCFRHLRDHVSTSVDSINSVLSAEFIRASVRGPEDIDPSLAVSASNGRYDEVRLEEERTSNFQDQLLPLVIGLLRTGKFPAVLRVYRDTLASDIKTSVKMTVLNMQLESDSLSGEGMADADGGGSSLGSKLKSLSPDSFLKLLEEIFRIVQTRLIRASEVKKAVEWIMGNLNGHYAADSVAAALAHGAVAPDLSQDAVDRSRSSLSSQNATRASFMQGSGHDAASPNISRNFRADILRENAEALFAACDAAHGRWAKIVGIRSQIHLKLRLQDFLSVYNISQEFITSTEKIGGRLGYSIRGTLQSQAKSFIEFQHESRMAKMRALLDQENWVEIDVPDEFQSIVNSLSSPDSNTYGESDAVPDDIDTKSNDTESISNGSSRVDVGQKELSQHVEQPDSNGMSSDHMGKNDSSRSTIETEHSSDVNTSQGSSSSTKERGKSALRVLYFRGVGYHMVNCGLYLVKMISEYIDMNNSLPTLSAEVVHRIAEILKLFNSRTAHLVLGANALQVSGLRSITARHLAMASQVISCTYAIIPEIRRILLLKVPDSYKGLLQSEIHRVETDYKNHRDEIHSKLVQIMRERLLVHLRSLPQIVEGWNRSEGTDIQPSQFARSLTKEVGYLLRTLSKLLLEEDVQSIFGQVVMILHSQISEAFSQFEISTPQAKSRLRCDLQHILGCIRSLPSDNLSKSDSPNWGPLDEFFAKNFDSESSQ